VGGSLSLPAYIDWTGHGAAESAPSAVFKGAHANLFAFEGKSEAIQHLVDKLLNPATRGQVRYTPAMSTVILSFVDVAKCASLAEPVGWTTGRECGLWTMLWETAAHGGLPRLVFWSPYVFIDYSLGLITGRGVWGWPKVGARIGMATDHPHAPAAWECRTLIFREFDPHKPGGEEALISVRALHPHAPESIWSRAGHFLEHASAELLSDVADFAVPQLLHPIMPAIALKQFRDSEQPDRACYQEIINSPCQLTGFHGGGPMDGPFEIEIAQCRSHQILTDLAGLPPGARGSVRVPVTWAGWLDFDFEAHAGRAVTR
jgi:hypothetical protein